MDAASTFQSDERFKGITFRYGLRGYRDAHTHPGNGSFAPGVGEGLELSPECEAHAGGSNGLTQFETAIGG